MAKKNAFLEKLKAQAAANESVKTQAHVEIDTMAMLLAVNEELNVGAGRAGFVLAAYLAAKMDIAKAITDELDEIQIGKKEIIRTRRDLAKRIKEILGKENWEKYKTLFPFLREHWEW